MRKVVYCPDCKAKGNLKRLLEIDENTKGVLYCWCKSCKQEKKIVINSEGK